MIELRFRDFKYADAAADNGDETINAIKMADGGWVILQYRERVDKHAVTEWADVRLQDD